MKIKLDLLFGDENKLFHSIFDSIAEGVIVADTNGKFLLFNQVAEEILGIGIQKIDQEEWSDFFGCFYPDQITPFPSDLLPLSQTIRTGKVSRETVFIKNTARPEGVFIDISGGPITGSNDSILGGIVVFKDVTENKKTEMSLEQSEGRLKAQFKSIPIPAYVWKKVGEHFVIIDFNDAANEFTQGKAAEVLGKKINKMYQDQSDPIYTDILNCFNNKKTVNREMSYQFQTIGEEKELNVRYVYTPPDLVVVYTEDITVRKNTERHLLKLSNAVNQTADAVIITDFKGNIEYVNPAFETITGYQKEEVIGKTPRIIKSGKYDQLFYENLWSTLLNGDPYKGEMLNKKKNGETFWSQNTITPIKNDGDKVTNFVSVIKDITEIRAKKEQEIRLKIAKEIQERFLLSNVSVPGYDIEGKNYPADETGGDYFDFLLTPDGNIWLTIADVSDHGIGSALIMAETRAYLRAYIETSSDPAKILGKLNNTLFSDLNRSHFVTLILIRLNTKKNEIEYSGAGHVPSYLINGKGEVAYVLESRGIPLGIMQYQLYENSNITGVSAGDILVLLTDGITEAHDVHDNEFGDERILNLIKSHRNEKAGDIIDLIYKEVCAFSNESQREDDITALICKKE